MILPLAILKVWAKKDVPIDMIIDIMRFQVPECGYDHPFSHMHGTDLFDLYIMTVNKEDYDVDRVIANLESYSDIDRVERVVNPYVTTV